MLEGQRGGIIRRRKKCMMFAYADDFALVTKTEDEMLSMLERFRRYMEKNKY